MHPKHAHYICRQHLNRYVRITTTDGNVHDGFIADVDSHNVTLAIPQEHWVNEHSGQSSESMDFRQFGFGRRRFRRRVLPLALLSSIYLLPFFGGGYGYGYPYFF